MINEVRNTVLSVLNKNNYGYISPSDFNLFAANAQMEIWEEYFSSYNKTINAENQRASGTDYADIESPIAETLETFLVTKNLTNFLNNKYYVPSLTTTGDESYYLLKVLCYPVVLVSGVQSGGEATNSLIDNTKDFADYGLVAGDIVVNTTTNLSSTYVSLLSPQQIILSSNIFPVGGATNNGYAIFKVSSLIWGFAIYFILWHSIPSIINQVVYLKGEFNKKNFGSYIKTAFAYWLVSLIGIAVLYLLFKDIN